MATLGDLKTRIINETQRDSLSDDLATTLTLHITRAIEFYANRRFWFNELRTTSAFTSGNAYLAVPTGLRQLDTVWVNIGPGYEMTKTDLGEIEALSTVGGNGQPTLYARYAPSGVDQIRAYPTPNSAYGVTWIGLKDEPALSASGDSNAWTLYAYDLINHRAKHTLYRDQFKDHLEAEASRVAAMEAETRLVSETARRLGTGRMRPTW